MFVIERDGHLGFWWDGTTTVHIEEQSVVFPSRSNCLEYLEKIHGREKAIDIIMMIKKSNGKSVLSF